MKSNDKRVAEGPAATPRLAPIVGCRCSLPSNSTTCSIHIPGMLKPPATPPEVESRSQLKRLAVLKGEPMPRFDDLEAALKLTRAKWPNLGKMLAENDEPAVSVEPPRPLPKPDRPQMVPCCPALDYPHMCPTTHAAEPFTPNPAEPPEARAAAAAICLRFEQGDIESVTQDGLLDLLATIVSKHMTAHAADLQRQLDEARREQPQANKWHILCKMLRIDPYTSSANDVAEAAKQELRAVLKDVEDDCRYYTAKGDHNFVSDAVRDKVRAALLGAQHGDTK